MAKGRVNIAVFASGGGTNLQALIDAEKAGKITSGTIKLVIANNAGAYAITRAENAGIDTAVILRKAMCGGSQEKFEDMISEELEKHNIGLIVLAGFMSILSERFTEKYDRRIINVHPSLIPSFCGQGFYGLRVHEAALKKGVKVTGATVHYVNEIPDGGEIIMQKAVDVKETDTPQTLQKRVMEEAEWVILPAATEKVCAEIIQRHRRRGIQMETYGISRIKDLIKGNPYVGRGIIIGKSADGKNAVSAYFIMGRSANSRNRVFKIRDNSVFTEPFDGSKVEDPSLIIYAAIREYENRLIVTNGDQTDTIYDGFKAGKSMAEALKSREFEPDAPNLTPRISGVMEFDNNDFTYEMSILKSIDPEGTGCARYTYEYPSVPGLGHFIHTYVTDGKPLPTFTGEPERTEIPSDIDEFTGEIWSNLDAENRISLYVRYTSLETGEISDRLINKNK